MLVILFFLRTGRASIIPVVTIPVSLIATFMVMNWLGFTLNNISMLALVLAVGIVIDDAVVVHENIFRWMEEKGMSAWEAAQDIALGEFGGWGEFGRIAVNVEAVYRDLEPGYEPAGIVEQFRRMAELEGRARP